MRREAFMPDDKPLQTWLVGLTTGLLLFLSLSVFGAARVVVEAQLADPDKTRMPIETGMAMHTGDALRFSLSNETDAYVYLIVVGSSGTARVLQPFSGKPADAWMSAGEVRQIPQDGGFLPLDKQVGPERVLLLSASAPIPNLTRLLVRLEDAAPDTELMRQVLISNGLTAQVLAFSHEAAIPTPGPKTESIAGNQPLVATPATQSDIAAAGSEEGAVVVLGGLGSRISAFQANRPLPAQLGTQPVPQVEKVQAFQSESSETSAAIDSTAAGKETSGLGSSLATWFGFGGNEDTNQAVAEKPVAIEADTFPLQANSKTSQPRALIEPEAPLVPAVIDNQEQASLVKRQESVVLVEPLAVEKSVQETYDTASGSSADTPPVEGSTAPEIPKNGRTASILASLFGPTPASEPADSAVQVDSNPTAKIEQAPALPLLLSLQEREVSATSEQAIAPNPDTDNLSATSPAQDAQPAVSEGDVNEQGSPTDTAAVADEQAEAARVDADKGLFGWLTGNSAQSEADSGVTQGSGATTVTTQPEVVSPVAAVEEAKEDAEEEVEKTDGSGLFGWLTSAKEDDVETTGAVTEVLSGAAIDIQKPQPQVEVEPTAEADKPSGLLAGLGALFGAGGEAESSAANKPEVMEKSPENSSQTRIQPAPVDDQTLAMTRRKNDQGASVVVLNGPQTPPQLEKSPTQHGNDQVLSAQGSRIKALLEPESATNTQQPSAVTTAARTTAAPASPQAVPVTADTPTAPPTGVAVVTQNTASSVAEAGTAQAPPLVLNPEESQQNVTQLALNSTPARTVKQAAAVIQELDLNDDNGLAGAVVLIISARGSGAGVVINDTGQVLTNWHLVRGLDRVAVAFKQPGGAQISTSELRLARVLRHSKYPDLALLAVEGGSPVAPAQIVSAKSGRAKLVRGRRLHTLNLSDTGAWQSTVAAVERVRSGSSWYSEQRVLHRATVIRADTEGQPGLSGVPLFNEHGEIAGLTTMVKADKNQLIAVSSQTLVGFLEQSK